MLKLILPTLGLAACIGASAQTESSGQERVFKELWSRLASRYETRFGLYENQLSGLQAEIDQVRTRKRISGQSNLTVDKDGEAALASTLQASKNDWGGEFSATAGEAGVSSSRIGAFHTFFSGRGKRLLSLDSISVLERRRLGLETENLLFDQWKAVISEKIDYDLLDAEIRFRQESLEQLTQVETLLAKLKAEGEVSANMLTPIALFRMDNDVRIRSLEVQKRIRQDLIRSRYYVPESLFTALAPEFIEAIRREPSADPPKPYDFYIDSLQAEVSRKRIRYSSLPQTGLDAGMGLDLGGFDGLDGVKVYARVGLDFNWSEFRPLPKIRTNFPVAPDVGLKPGLLGDLENQVAEFEKQADNLVSESLEKMKYGRISSAFEISDMIRRRLEQKSQMQSLRAASLQAKLASIRNIRELAIEFPLPL